MRDGCSIGINSCIYMPIGVSVEEPHQSRERSLVAGDTHRWRGVA